MAVVTTTDDETLLVMLRLIGMLDRKITCNKMIVRHVRANFGIDVDTTTYLWNLLVASFTDLPANFKLKHLLQYENYTSRYKCAKCTFRSWVMFVSQKLNDLEVVSK